MHARIEPSWGCDPNRCLSSACIYESSEDIFSTIFFLSQKYFRGYRYESNLTELGKSFLSGHTCILLTIIKPSPIKSNIVESRYLKHWYHRGTSNIKEYDLDIFSCCLYLYSYYPELLVSPSKFS